MSIFHGWALDCDGARCHQSLRIGNPDRAARRELIGEALLKGWHEVYDGSWLCPRCEAKRPKYAKNADMLASLNKTKTAAPGS